MDGGREGRGEKREAVWEEEVEVGKEGEKEREKEGWMGERKKWGEVRMDGEGGIRKEGRKEGMRKKRIGDEGRRDQGMLMQVQRSSPSARSLESLSCCANIDASSRSPFPWTSAWIMS